MASLTPDLSERRTASPIVQVIIAGTVRYTLRRMQEGGVQLSSDGIRTGEATAPDVPTSRQREPAQLSIIVRMVSPMIRGRSVRTGKGYRSRGARTSRTKVSNVVGVVVSAVRFSVGW
jgi:hypothetical protein